MGGLFSKPKIPSPPKSIISNQNAESERIANEKKEKNRQIQGKLRARRTGGMRMLLAQDRENSQLGINDTLG